MKETKDKDKKLRVGGKTLDKQRVLTFSVMLGAFLLAILISGRFMSSATTVRTLKSASPAST